MHRRRFLVTVGAGVAAPLTGCLGRGDGTTATIQDETLTLATTTSTYDTGLLGELHRGFEDRHGVGVEAVAQGTGAALQTGRNGDADVVMVHAPDQEIEFVESGYGINRRRVMANDYVLVGPADDPAGVDDTETVTAAFDAIAESDSLFVSRGDNSGTHTAELKIWDEAELNPTGEWYQEAGSGMGDVVMQASQRGGYTLSDRGTFTSMSDRTDLEIRFERPEILDGTGDDTPGAALLANPYSVIGVNPAVHEHVAYDVAMGYIGFLTSPRGQELIDEFTAGGERLFVGTALSDAPGGED